MTTYTRDRDHYAIEVDYSQLPIHIQAAAKRWIEQGKMGGDFLYSVLSNRLVEAYNRADAVNAAAMQVWARWLYMECPPGSWRDQHPESWSAAGGLSGAGWACNTQGGDIDGARP